MAPSGADILLSPVRKLFGSDDAEVDFDSPRQVSLVEIMQEALECHARGITFRERGAGPGLDRDMTMPGFNVTAGVNQETGFIFGGNANNCGTWMDKVGESAWAGNKGVPATPRSVTTQSNLMILQKKFRNLCHNMLFCPVNFAPKNLCGTVLHSPDCTKIVLCGFFCARCCMLVQCDLVAQV